MNFNLKNKKVLITGSSGGIGKSLCKVFLKMECKIIFTSSNEGKLNGKAVKIDSDGALIISKGKKTERILVGDIVK